MRTRTCGIDLPRTWKKRTGSPNLAAMKPRTHFTFRIDRWDADGENIIEHLAGIEDHQLAMATYLAACQGWPGAVTPAARRAGHRAQPPHSSRLNCKIELEN